MNTIKKSLHIFLHFLQRDLLILRPMLSRYIINNVMILPCLVIFNDGYVMQMSLFGTNANLNTMRFIGSLLLPLLTLTFTMATTLLYDIEHNRFIDYQITVLNPALVILERIVFNAFFTFMLVVPFYPLCKVLLGTKFVTTQTSWPLLFVMLFLASFTASAYHIAAMCILPNSSMFIRLWARVSAPLFLLGGFVAPWAVMYEISPTVAYVLLLNPFMYISEGIRQSIIGGTFFFSAMTCVSALILFCIFLYGVALWFFKKRMDHV